MLEQRDGAALRRARPRPRPAGARRWFTSFGSCSVAEPLEDLPALGLLEDVSSVTDLGGRRRRLGFDVDHLPYGVFSSRRRAARVGVRIGDLVLDLAPVAAGRELDVGHVFEAPSLNPLHGAGPPDVDVGAPLADRPADRRGRARRVEPHLVPLDDVTLHLPFEVADYVDFYASRTTPPTSAGSSGPTASRCMPNWRHLPVGYHGRAGTVVVVGHAGRPAERPAQGARTSRADVRPERSGSTSRPSSASSSAPRPRSGEPVPVTGLRRPRLRRGRAQRLVGARHPGLGVRAARAVPRQVLRDVDLATGSPRSRRSTPPGSTCPARTRGRSTTSAPTPRAGLDIDVEVRAQRRGRQPAAVPHDVLVARADARPPDRQRRLAAHRRPVRLRHDQRPRARPARLVARAVAGAARSRSPAAGSTFLEDGDEVVLRYSAPGTGGGRITLGEVRGRIEPAREA